MLGWCTAIIFFLNDISMNTKMIERSPMEHEDDFRSLDELEPKTLEPHKNAFYANLGDVINGLVYFGKQRSNRAGITAAFICPNCDELFRARVSDVKKDKIHSCKACAK